MGLFVLWQSLKAMAAPCASLVASPCALANKAHLLPGRVAVASSRSSNREVVRRCAAWRSRNCAGMLSSGFVGKRVTRSICFKPSACSKRFIHSTVAKDAPLVVRSFSLECRARWPLHSFFLFLLFFSLFFIGLGFPCAY